jgi:NADH-quinone oxidoreductase subunit F
MELVLTKNMRSDGETVWIEEYEKARGYSGLRKAVREMTPLELVKLVADSKLKGRGGAGFPTGVKWHTILPIENSARPRYLVCNLDEMEPGTFKDRFLVEGDPHQLIEGLILAGYACEADIGYIFVRGEYVKQRRIIERALSESQSKGYVGKNILGKGWDFEIYIHSSAGRYMCGEETGLLNSLEGGRANPRTKPPYPGTSGLWGRPTVVNNVETLCCVPHIVERGAEWFKSLGTAKDSGTKIYGATGKVKHPGAFELPMGSTLREVIWEHAGGMQDGYSFRATLPGGASTHFMGEDLLDYPLDYESLKDIKHFFGTGTAIILDDKTCPVGLCHNLEVFYARESCGWCTPCREGLPWLRDVLLDLENGRGRPGDVDTLLLDQAKNLGPNTYCALAMGAVTPLISAIEMFREDFDAHVELGRCPYGARGT